MKDNGPKIRSEIDSSSKWDIEAMYPDESQWERDIEDAISMSRDFAGLSGHITDSPSSLLNALESYTKISRKLEHAFVYARMRHDEDNADSKYTAMNDRAMSAAAEISAATSFFTPELLRTSPDEIRTFIESEPRLEVYRFLLESTMRNRDHVLTPDQESILASLGDVLGAPDEIFTVLNNADMDFGDVRDGSGNKVHITHGNYTSLMESADREVRKNTFEKLYDEYRKLNNTIASMYSYSVKGDAVSARLRKFSSSLDAALSPEMIPASVYDSLIEAVHEYLPAMYKYVGIRKRALGLDEIKMYDVYCPLVRPADLSCTYEEAVETACRALAPLGGEYISVFRKGVTEDKWVDKYENKGKTSGAYSFGSYDSKPYILMNFNGELRDILTLVHEGGHSMHSYYTRKTQPFIYGSHSIFTAEVASTVNETLTIRYLLDHADSREMKLYILNTYIDEFKSTLFRQTMFAEFEKLCHEEVEGGGSLTAEWMNRKYDELNTLYFGPEMSHDDLIQYEWSRIPHFYRAYYVYQYATGYSAANAIANRILGGGDAERDDYLKFLTTGDSDYPIELLKIAGVDMSSREPVESALETFSSLVDELDSMI
jgi:oligoendopeptidase F